MKIFEITIGGITFSPTYYALMYIFAFVFAWWFLKKFFQWKSQNDLDELVFLCGLGVIFGGRIGYVLLYNLEFYVSHPMKIFAIWEGGMSFHWGLIGVILAAVFFSKKFEYRVWNVFDALAIVTPVGLAFGRFGNYLNNELYGFSPYHGPFAMQVGNNFHFPSPLLEMLLEGIILGTILFFLFFRTNIKNSNGKLSGIFLTGYAFSRIFIEFFRLPDENIGYIFESNFMTMGMLYSLPMLLFGCYLLLRKS